jgi:DNA (cytosine-5)-methyltransferase 1
MLRVADLFCGPGGISEGLRLAGFKIVFGLDKVKSTTETFKKNHPEATVLCEDATTFDINKMPEFDVLVGGPPCVNFSTSKGTRANVLEGLRLVQAFLRVVYERKPQYWIMENVPGLCLHLPETIPLSWIGIDKPGELHIPVRNEFNTADYGVAQIRRRFLVGNYPIPDTTHQGSNPFASEGGRLPWRTLGEILRAFPDPDDSPGSSAITDPNYGFNLPTSLLSDHFYDVRIPDAEARRIREAKTAHPYMGMMAFPDRLNRPARTVVSTQLGRETLVIAQGSHFRRATIRECATIQGFPITYQFWANGINARYKMAGDAVPPLLAFSVGKGILQNEGLPVPITPAVNMAISELAPPVEFKERIIPMVLPLDKSFKQLVPGKEVRGCRVELDNLGKSPSFAVGTVQHRNLVEWVARLHVGEGKHLKKDQGFTLDEALWELAGYCEERGTEALHEFLQDVELTLCGFVPDATSLQAVWTRRSPSPTGPQMVGDKLISIVDRHFPKEKFGNVRVSRSGKFDIIPPRGLLLRLAAGLAVTAYACELANADSTWIQANQKGRYWVETWEGENTTQQRLARKPAGLLVETLKVRQITNESLLFLM